MVFFRGAATTCLLQGPWTPYPGVSHHSSIFGSIFAWQNESPGGFHLLLMLHPFSGPAKSVSFLTLCSYNVGGSKRNRTTFLSSSKKFPLWARIAYGRTFAFDLSQHCRVRGVSLYKFTKFQCSKLSHEWENRKKPLFDHYCIIR